MYNVPILNGINIHWDFIEVGNVLALCLRHFGELYQPKPGCQGTKVKFLHLEDHGVLMLGIGLHKAYKRSHAFLKHRSVIHCQRLY